MGSSCRCRLATHTPPKVNTRPELDAGALKASAVAQLHADYEDGSDARVARFACTLSAYSASSCALDNQAFDVS